MATEWVAPVVTGVVGVVGVTGTYLTSLLGRNAAATQAREHRDHALKDRAHAEKREAYVGFLEAVQRALRASAEIRGLGTKPETRAARLELRSAALAEVSMRREHLRLAAPTRVRKLAQETHRDLSGLLRASIDGETRKFDVVLQAALLASMKQDLGYELAPADVDALARQPEDEDADSGADSSRTGDAS